MTSFNNFADLASFVAASRENDGLTQTYEGAFIEHSEMAKLSIVEAPEALDMPDPEQVRAATEMMMQTMFDVLRDTRKRLLDHLLQSGKQAQSVDRDKLDQTLLRLALPARDVRRLKRFAQRELPKTATNAAVIERLSTVIEAAEPERL